MKIAVLDYSESKVIIQDLPKGFVLETPCDEVEEYLDSKRYSMSECHYMSSDNLKVQLFVEEDIENVQTMIKCETCGDYGTVHKNDCDDCDGFGEIHYNHESDKVIDILSGVTEMCNKLEQLGYTHEESKELVVNTLINW